MSTTPRTDEELCQPAMDDDFYVPADFARQLETELAEALASKDRISKRAEAIRRELVAVTKERDELKSWKDAAISVDNEWDCQKLGRLIGAPLGGSIRKALMQKVPELLAQVVQMREALYAILPVIELQPPPTLGQWNWPQLAQIGRDALSSPPPPVVPMADVRPLVDLLGNFLRNYEFGEKADKAMESVLQTFLAKHPTFNLTPPANS